MNNETSNYLQREADYHHAKKVLERQGYDLSDILRQHKWREIQWDLRQPVALDLQYGITTPDSWRPHFEQHVPSVPLSDGVPLAAPVVKGEPPVLACDTLRRGGQFLLSKGQRTVLRERYSMTPTKTIEVSELSFYPGTNIVERIKLTSCIHITEEQRRKHVLRSCLITEFGEFMNNAREIDAQEIVDKVTEPKTTKQKETTAKVQALAEEYI